MFTHTMIVAGSYDVVWSNIADAWLLECEATGIISQHHNIWEALDALATKSGIGDSEWTTAPNPYLDA